MTGTFYSVGTGPGDPGLLTYSAVETIRSCGIIALPNSGAGNGNVVKTVVQEHIRDKQVVECAMPMIKNRERLAEFHEAAAGKLRPFLDRGLDVAFLTLGDPSIYSTALYVQEILEENGYDCRMIPGVPSFCAVAARLNVSLCEGATALHVVPASYRDPNGMMSLKGNKVFMKAGKNTALLTEELRKQGREVLAVECCGMQDEKVHRSFEDIGKSTGYFCTFIVKE